jgi:hypothetical protein
MVSVGFAKLLLIRVRIYSKVEAASLPNKNVIKFLLSNLQYSVFIIKFIFNTIFFLNLLKDMQLRHITQNTVT